MDDQSLWRGKKSGDKRRWSMRLRIYTAHSTGDSICYCFRTAGGQWIHALKNWRRREKQQILSCIICSKRGILAHLFISL